MPYVCLLPGRLQLRTGVKHREDVNAIAKRPSHHITDVSRGLPMELPLEPRRILPEVFCQLSDALAGGSKLLKNCPSGAVLKDRPSCLCWAERARIGPDRLAGACEITRS